MHLLNPTWGIIGVGQLGASIAEGIYRAQAPFDLLLSPRSEARVRELAERFPALVGRDNQELVDRADHVILAARPDTFTRVGMDRLRESEALQAWSDACQFALDAKHERGR